MSEVKAYLINSVRLSGEQHPASTKEKPSIVEFDEDTFERLEALGAAREPTKEELAVFKSQQGDKDGTAVTRKAKKADKVDAASEKKDDADAKQPASGAKGDPSSAPKGKAADAKDDLGV